MNDAPTPSKFAFWASKVRIMEARWLRIALAAVAALVSGATAMAQVTVYSDQAAFAAAAGPLRTVAFSAGPTSSVPSAAPYTNLYDVTFDGVCFQRVFNHFNLFAYTFPNVTMRAELPPGTYAVGWSLSVFYPVSGKFTITLSSGQVYTIQTPDPYQEPVPFFGIVSSSPIAWVSESFDNTYPVFPGPTYGKGFSITASAGSVSSCPAPANTAPVANAGPGQSIHAGSTVNLNGSQSFDDNTPTASLGYAWSFVSRPTGSTATLTNANTATPSFVADKAGTYTVQLIVTDGGGLQSAVSQVVVSSLNQTPTANAGADQLVVVFQTVQLNGSGSTDPDHDTVTYSWAITSKPAGSAAVLNGSGSATPNFQPDAPGSYTITLTVSDAFGQGTPDTVEITAATGAAYAEQKLMCAANIVSGLGPSQVTTVGNQTALGNFLSEAVKAIQRGTTAIAIGKLNEAIERTNGCEANPSNPSPDGNGPGRDWVTDCGAQPPILVCLRAARDALAP